MLIDVLPALTLFGLGISLVVAPLTSTLMNSIPSRNAGLGSAINNALSRVGQPLVGAVLFVVVSATFYASLGSQVRASTPTTQPSARRYPPLNQPTDDVSPEEAEAARTASVEAFRVASLALVALLVGGAIANQVGLRGAAAGQRAEASDGAAGEPAAPAA